MDSQNQDKPILPIAFFIIQFLFIVIIVSIVSINEKGDKIEPAEYDRQPAISIENISNQLSGIPTAYIGAIEQLLAKTIELNSNEFSIKESNAEIRNGSLKTVQFDRFDGIYYSMIVDIPNLEQSYQIYALYPLDAETPNPATYYTRFVLCLDDHSEKIYPNFNCKDLFESDARQVIASDYLQYYNFDQFGAGVSRDYTTVNIEPNDFNNVDQEAIISETKQAISSLGISPDLFKYYVMQAKDIDFHIEP